MLRAIIGGIAIVMVVIALVATVVDLAAWPVLAGTVAFAAGCVFERRYHAGRAGQAPDGRFRATSERFVDPETGLLTTVWADPQTGERRYVADGEPPSPAA